VIQCEDEVQHPSVFLIRNSAVRNDPENTMDQRACGSALAMRDAPIIHRYRLLWKHTIRSLPLPDSVGSESLTDSESGCSQLLRSRILLQEYNKEDEKRADCFIRKANLINLPRCGHSAKRCRCGLQKSKLLQ